MSVKHKRGIGPECSVILTECCVFASLALICRPNTFVLNTMGFQQILVQKNKEGKQRKKKSCIFISKGKKLSDLGYANYWFQKKNTSFFDSSPPPWILLLLAHISLSQFIYMYRWYSFFPKNINIILFLFVQKEQFFNISHNS